MFVGKGALVKPTVVAQALGHAFEQVPSEPTTLHASHAPEHEALQQYPSEQKPVTQSAADTHVVPLGAELHAPIPLHVEPHSLSGLVFAGMNPHTPSYPLPFFAAEHA